MSLFNNCRIYVTILFGPSLLSRFKDKITLKTSVLPVGVIKDDSIFKGGNHNIFFLENQMNDWIPLATLVKWLFKTFAISEGISVMAVGIV